MIRLLKKFLKCLIAFILMISSVLAIYIYIAGDFDPVKLAVELKNANQRDQSLSVIEHAIENDIGNQDELRQLQEQYEYSLYEKSKDFAYHGAIKGNVFNAYSGLGCLASDLCVFGDARDLTKQGYNYVTGKDVDEVIAVLSTIGIVTTAAELTGGGAAADAGVSVIKTTVKYISKSVKRIPDSVLMLIKKGKRFKPEVYRNFWMIFKGTKFNLPNFTSVLSAIKNEKYLGTAAHLTEHAKTGAVIFIKKTGEAGLDTYAYFQKIGFGKWYLDCIKKNPKAALGISKFRTVLRSMKFIKKHGLLLFLAIIIYTVASMLLIFGGFWVPLFALASSLGYLFLKMRKTKRARVKRDSKLKSKAKVDSTAKLVDRSINLPGRSNSICPKDTAANPNIA